MCRIPNHELKLYGPGAMSKPTHESGLQLDSAIDAVTGNPMTWVWTGATEATWALTVRDKRYYVDVSGLGRIRWRVRPRGLTQMRPVVKLADGAMLVGDVFETGSRDFRENEFFLADVRWKHIDPERVVGSADKAPTDAAGFRLNPDLTKVDEVGFTDLTHGGGHGAAAMPSNCDWIEVYGEPVPR